MPSSAKGTPGSALSAMMAAEQHFTMLCLRAKVLGGGSLGAFLLSAQIPVQQCGQLAHHAFACQDFAGDGCNEAKHGNPSIEQLHPSQSSLIPGFGAGHALAETLYRLIQKSLVIWPSFRVLITIHGNKGKLALNIGQPMGQEGVVGLAALPSFP